MNLPNQKKNAAGRIHDWAQKGSHLSPVEWERMPEIYLYMDQVITYMQSMLSLFERSEETRLLTSSMINNYVKNSIVKAPIRKHYKRYHLAFLIVVTILKRVYSLSEISQMIAIQTAMKRSDLKTAYDTFAAYFEEVLHAIINDGSYSKAEKDPYRRLLFNVVQAVALKIYAQIELNNPLFNSQNSENLKK